MRAPFPAYQGAGPYLFICYSHSDSEVVYPELVWLKESGLHIWYDEGISPGTVWREELAEAIEGAALILFFVSPASVQSSNCVREISFAVDQDLKLGTGGEGFGNGDGNTVYRLREGIERFMITDINNPAATAIAQSQLAVMWDEISADETSHFNHVPGGCNVLFMDGHVEFLRYAGGQGNVFPVKDAGIAFHILSHMLYP